TPLPRPMQGDGLEPYLHAIGRGMLRNRAIIREQGQLLVAPGVFVKGLDEATPGLTLGVVDLAEIQHLALYYFAGGAALALDNIPVAMLFAIFESSVEAQEHDANKLTSIGSDQKDTWSTLQR